MKQLLISISALLFTFNVIQAQCPPPGYVITNQQEIDDFAINYPNCTFLDGGLSIEGSGVTNLLGLSQLEGIANFLSITGTNLLHTNGLENLIEGPLSIQIVNNDFLQDITGFDNIFYLMDLLIDNNNMMSQISGFSSLGECMILHITNNDGLTNLDGFVDLAFLDELDVSNNSNLEEIDAFIDIPESSFINIYENESLTTIGGFDNLANVFELNILSNDALDIITGFPNLESVQMFNIQNNNSLQDISGFNNISFGGFLEISQNAALSDISGFNFSTFMDVSILFNDQLSEISGFNNSVVEATLNILNNDILMDIFGLENADFSILADMVIQNNPLLGFCSITSICDWLDFGNVGSISNNDVGCNSSGEIEMICDGGSGNCELEIATIPDNVIGFCEGDCITLEAYDVSGATGIVTYEWNDGSVGDIITVCPDMTFEFIVIGTDEADCMDTVGILVEVYPAPSVFIDGPTQICNGQAITLNATPYDPVYTYQWSTGEIGESIIVTDPGTYSVSLTTPEGCQTVYSTTIDECMTDCSLFTDISNIVCEDNGTPSDPLDDVFTFEVLVTGINTGSSWIADDPNSTIGIYDTPITFGPYSISIGDLFFNITDDLDPNCSVFVEVPAPATCSFQCEIAAFLNATTCDDNGTPDDNSDDLFSVNVFVTGDNTGSSWSANDPNGTVGLYGQSTVFGPYNISDGPVAVTIVDDVDPNCTEFIVLEAPEPCSFFCDMIVEFVGPNEVCEGDQITIVATVDGGTEPYSFMWSGGQTTSDIIVEDPGVYVVTVTDDNGCEAINEVQINECSGDCLLEYFIAGIYCNDEGTPDPDDDTWGFDIVVEAENGSAAWYSDVPMPNGGLYGEIVSYGPFLITDGDVVLVINDELIVDCFLDVLIAPPGPCSECNMFVEIVGPTEICEGDIITLEAIADNGAAPYTYEWSDGQQGSVALIENPGLYEVTATDNNGCAATNEIEIIECNEECLLDYSYSVLCDDSGTTDPTDDTWTFDLDVFAQNGGSGWIATDGTTGLYGQLVTFGPYFISEGDVFMTISDIDFPDCLVSFVISPPQPCSSECDLEVFIEGPSETCANEAVILEAVAINGTEPYSYFWSDGQIGESITVIEEGVYSVTATDADNCDAVAEYIVSYFPPIYLEIEAEDLSLCESAPVELLANGEGLNLTYEWSTGQVGETITVEPVLTTAYSVTATNEFGCTESADITISIGQEDFNDFESGWGIWNDGGADAALSDDPTYANSGQYSLLIKDNTNTSVITTDAFLFAGSTEFQIDFNYITTGFDNETHDFWLQVSLDDGATFTTVEEWNLGDEFENEVREFENIIVPGPFTDQTKVRFRCDAAGNNDKVYIDDIYITSCNVVIPSCSDGIQNGDETGVDCGGSMCAPCSDCNIYDLNDWESGWGIWIDGGADAAISDDPIYANSGTHSLLLKDNTSSSVATTVDLDLSNVASIQLDFNFITNGFDNEMEDFWFQISEDGGLTFETYEEWSYLNQFVNDEREYETVLINGPFSETTQLRFRCDASGNNDKLYIDDVQISLCIVPTCDDGIQNGNETGIDCGGPDCDPCSEPCEEVDFNDVETDWGIWNDGGADAARVSDTTFANSGMYSFLIKDNTSTSVITTDPLDLSIYDSLIIDFNFIADGFNNNTQDFWLQVSTDNGATFTTVWDWIYGDDFENGIREFENIPVLGPFTNETLIRFRCDATGNNDKIYIDDILLTGCIEGGGLIEDDVPSRKSNEISLVSVYPNPVGLGMQLNVKIDRTENFNQIVLLNLSGQVISKRQLDSEIEELTFETGFLEEGMYLIQLKGEKEIVTKRVMILK